MGRTTKKTKNGHRLTWAWIALALAGCDRLEQQSADPDVIELSGTVEARESDLGFQVGGRIQRLLLDEGERVEAGVTVATLEARDYQLDLRHAQAQAEGAQAALAALRAGTRKQEIKVAEAAVNRARAEYRFARSEVERARALVEKELAPREQLDRAEAEVEVTRAALEESRQRLALLQEGPREEDINQAAAEYRARSAAVDSARRRLDYTQLRSPVAGIVSVRLAETGEVVQAGEPVLRVAQLDTPWVRGYLPEPALSRVEIGQPVEITLDGRPDRVFEGQLTFIAPEAEFTPKTVETRALRVDLVYRIKVQVANPEGVFKRGMPADLKIRIADES